MRKKWERLAGIAVTATFATWLAIACFGATALLFRLLWSIVEVMVEP